MTGFFRLVHDHPQGLLGGPTGIFLATGILLALGLLGCEPNKNTANPDAAKAAASASQTPSLAAEDPASLTLAPTAAARSLLAECLKTYRSAERYQDDARLVIQGASNLTLPMKVAWEKPNRLGLQTGSLQGLWTSTTWEAQSRGTVNPFPNQRLVRPLPARIDLDWIGDDTMGGLLVDPMTKPIQLELLLSNDLTERLASNDSILKVLEPMGFEEVRCERIAVEKQIDSQSLRWVLWIDPQSKLLRKIELPPQFYYPGATANQLSGITCAIELSEARTDEPIDWSQWQMASSPQEVRVARWVAPPPIASTPILGKVIDPIDFKDPDGAILLDTAEPKKPFQVLLWIDDQAEARALLDDLLNVRRVLLEKELAPAGNILLVTSAKDASGLREKLAAWNCDLPLAVDSDDTLHKAFEVRRSPAMIILDRARRVQVAEYVVTPQAIASIPELLSKLRSQQDLASRQLQQDLDNQSRFVAALHRVALDKEQTAKLPEITEFPFAMFGMRRDWKIQLDAPLVSASGVWYPQSSLNAQSVLSPNAISIATLDEDGLLQTFSVDGTKRLCAKIDPDLADGAKRLITSVDPWTHQWIAVVPEGLPRFWIAPSQPVNNAPVLATAYNTQAAETPVCHAWFPQQLSTPESQGTSSVESKLAIATSESRLMIINPINEQRLDGTFREPPVAFVPGLTAEGSIGEWDVLYDDGSLHKISNLNIASQDASRAGTLEARLDRLEVRIASGSWLWGNHGSAPSRTVEMFLGKLPSGETGILVANPSHQTLARRALCARPEQTRLLGATRLKDGTLMGVATGPSRVLHLFSGDLRLVDQASLNARILGASLVTWQDDVKLLVALEREISCWSIDVPNAPEPKTNSTP